MSKRPKHWLWLVGRCCLFGGVLIAGTGLAYNYRWVLEDLTGTGEQLDTIVSVGATWTFLGLGLGFVGVILIIIGLLKSGSSR